MLDDNVGIKKAGDYCPKCDTFWCEPGASVFEIEIWNKAIEAAATWIYNYEEQLINNFEKCKSIQASDEIRKLKK